MVPQVGQRIGPYEVLGRLGTGGMGLVFSAWDARLQRDVAIKILRDEYATPEMRSRFLQEARAASGLNHPNICTIFDIGEQDGDPYLVMELLKGDTLRSRIYAGTLSVRDLVQVAYDVADALMVAHARGIIHRDIKPANIVLVDKPGGGFGTKVLDFGLAKVEAYGAESLFDLTHAGTTVGTVSYMSPEQARGEPLDARSDLFSLGVVLYEMACGRVPFQGATSALVFVELLSKQPDAIRPQNPQISAELERIILTLLEKDRSLRYQSAQELMSVLAELSEPGSSQRISTPVQARHPLGRLSETSAPISSRGIPLGNDFDGEEIEPLSEEVPSFPPSEQILRPVPRVVGGDSSAYNRTLRESSAFEIPPAPPAEDELFEPEEASVDLSPQEKPAEGSGVRIVAEPAGPSYDPIDEDFFPPSRPIVPLSARAADSSAAIPAMSLRRKPQMRGAHPRFIRIEEVRPEDLLQPPLPPEPTVAELPREPVSAETESGRGYAWLLLVVFLLAGAVAGAWKWWPRHPHTDTAKVIPLLLAPVSNSTGDVTLSQAVAAGIEIDLNQSSQFLVGGPQALVAALHAVGVNDQGSSDADDVLCRAALAASATEVLIPSLRRNGNFYVVGARVLFAQGGGEAFHAEESAQSRDQIPDALDRLVLDLRTSNGDLQGSDNSSVLPLSTEATNNLDALASYTVGRNALARGQWPDAITSLEHAVFVAPQFTQAYLTLAEMYRRQGAESSAESAAAKAESSAGSVSSRTKLLADASYAINTTGDLQAAESLLQPVLDSTQGFVRAKVDLALVLQGQGRFSESVDRAQDSLRRAPFNEVSVALIEAGYIAQDRLDAANHIQGQTQRNGISVPEMDLLIAYLQTGDHGSIDTSAPIHGRVALGEMQAALLDATGQLQAGTQLWQGIAAEANAMPQLASSAASVLAFGALDNALLENCSVEKTMAENAEAYPLGPEAHFRVGMAAALCGDIGSARASVDYLTRSFPQSFAAKNYWVPALNAVVQWKSGDDAGALQLLTSARSYDLMTMNAYLRGLIQLHSGQPQAAISEFQFVLQHPGATALVLPVLHPMAQMGLARAFATSGDRINAAAGFAAFQQLWTNADSGATLLAEAHKGSAAH